MGKRSFVSCLSLLSLGIAAFAQNDTDPPAAPIVEIHRASHAQGNYALSANDLIEITVFQEKDLQTTSRISRDGTITFPLIGAVSVGGKTAQQAAEVIREMLEKDYLV